jgi:hypothetical protein
VMVELAGQHSKPPFVDTRRQSRAPRQQTLRGSQL